jgi:hypothetical protein
MNKSYFIFEEGLHEYTIVDTILENDVRRLELQYSNAEHWDARVRGTVAISMNIDDLDIIFSPQINHIDYGQLHLLRLLINFERETNSNDKNKEKSEVIETTNKLIL